MRTYFQNFLLASGLIALSFSLLSCDEALYDGMNGNEVAKKASKLPLPEAYDFYLVSYNGTAPPMLDAVVAFPKFGKEAKLLLTEKALSTQSKDEFEADLFALAYIDNTCEEDAYGDLIKKFQMLNVRKSSIDRACGVETDAKLGE